MGNRSKFGYVGAVMSDAAVIDALKDGAHGNRATRRAAMSKLRANQNARRWQRRTK